MKNIMTPQQLFSMAPSVKIERSSFDRSHSYKSTLDRAGVLYPFYVDEALPGDTFNCKVSAFARLATPLKPIMDNMYMDTFFFSVPARLVWDNWQKFMGEKENPTDVTEYTIPYVQAPTGGFERGSVYDYLGIPVEVENIKVNALPLRAINLIYNQWFRDQNLISSALTPKGDGPDSYGYYNLYKRAKRPDYFTSCLPWQQKGQPIEINIGNEAPVTYQHIQNRPWAGRKASDGNMSGPTAAVQLDSNSLLNTGSIQIALDPNGTLFADLSSATTIPINELREAFQMQRFLERDARSGTRYKELIKAHFGVDHPDLNWRPEYLGGGSTPVNFHVVPQTSPTGTYATTPQGNLSAYGTAMFNNHGFTKSFTEHCYVIGLVMVRAQQSYQSGLNRMWSRSTRYDHYFPVLSHLGEQPVLNKELHATGTSTDDLAFGYNERYSDYKYKPSLICGKLRSSDPQSLDFWHLAQDFSATPVLNQMFIEENPPVERIIAVTDEPQFILDAYIGLRCARPMPLYSVPGMVDHF
ncbi:MAG: major capsid protein [Microvirus sp.]|nr:MAG: major capsid protein [Microvirus sp.]